MNKSLGNYFNNLIKDFSENANETLNLNFFEGGIKGLLKEIKNTLPFAKIAIVAKENTFLSVGKGLVQSLEKQGHKVITILFKEKPFYSLDDTLALFSLPEDVRATILLDGDLAKVNNYFVSNKNILTYFYLFSVGGFELFNSTINIRNGNVIDSVFLNNLKIKVFLIEENLKSQLPTFFAELFCGLVSFYDYRIYGFITGAKLNATIFNATTQNIMEGYSSIRSKEKLHKLIIAYFSICIANAFTLGEICSYSSVNVLQEIIGNTTPIKLYSAITILQLYSVYFNSETDQLLCTANYTDIAKILSEKTLIKENFILTSLKKQTEKINRKNLFELKEKLKTEFKNLALLKDNVLGHYAFLDGKTITSEELNEINKYVVFAGDFYHLPNGLSLLREEGVFNLD